MRFLSFRTNLFAAVCAVHEATYDTFLDAWQDIGERHLEHMYTMGWRPPHPDDREAVAAFMASGNRGDDSALVEHAGVLDG